MSKKKDFFLDILILEDGPLVPKRHFQSILRRVITQKTEEYTFLFEINKNDCQKRIKKLQKSCLESLCFSETESRRA